MKLLTVEAVAETLAVSRSTARRMMIENVIPTIILRSGRRKKILRCSEEALQRFLLAQERQSKRALPRLAVVNEEQS